VDAAAAAGYDGFVEVEVFPGGRWARHRPDPFAAMIDGLAGAWR